MEPVLTALTELLQPIRLIMLLVGACCGLVIGIIPGLSGIVGMALLVPFTYQLDPYAAVALLLGMGSVTTTSDTVTAVLFGVPGTVGSAATVLDGHAMAKAGESERAFGAAFSASMIGGLFGAVILAVAIPFLQSWVRLFGSPELFALAIFGLSMVATLSAASPLRGVMSVCAGLAFAFIALDDQTATERWTFGQIYLWEGIPLVPVFLGIFAIPELEGLLRRPAIAQAGGSADRSGLRRGIRDTLAHPFLVLRSSTIGALLGSIPGIGAAVIDWIAYGHAKRSVRAPNRFGSGDVRGVIAPEAANNAKEGGALIPTIAFGIPGSASMTILLGALMVQGLTPGPDMLTKHIDVTFTMVFSVALANVIGTGLCLAFSRRLGAIAVLPTRILVPVVLVFVFLGAFQASRDALDLLTLIVFGAIGLGMKAARWSRPAFALGFVLGPAIERYFFISHSIFEWTWLTRPLVGVLLALAVATVFRALPEWLRAVRQRGTTVAQSQSAAPLTTCILAILVSVYGISTSLSWETGAALFPRIVFAVMIVAATGSLVGDRLRGVTFAPGKGDGARDNTLRGAIRIGAMAVSFAALFLAAGWFVATAVFTAGTLSLTRQHGYRTVALTTTGLVLFIWIVFDRLLAIPWPEPWILQFLS